MGGQIVKQKGTISNMDQFAKGLDLSRLEYDGSYLGIMNFRPNTTTSMN